LHHCIQILKFLLIGATKIILLTVPPILKHAYLVAHRKQVLALNSWIKKKNDSIIAISDIARLFYTRKRQVKPYLYEETFGTGKPDLIHWNEKGMDAVDKELHDSI
jgi:hypothetical protein